jgi:mannose-6-phosphate isomerase-like protein (cupin superfamily)
MHDNIEANWRSRGFSCAVWTDPPGKNWVDYVHDTDELLMVLEGELELTMAGRKLRPRQGEEILIPANTKHSVKNVGKTSNRWFYGYKKN